MTATAAPPAPPELPPGLTPKLTLRQLALWLGMCEKTARALSRNGELPPPARVGRRLLWDAAEVSAHLAARREVARV